MSHQSDTSYIQSIAGDSRELLKLSYTIGHCLGCHFLSRPLQGLYPQVDQMGMISTLGLLCRIIYKSGDHVYIELVKDSFEHYSPEWLLHKLIEASLLTAFAHI